MTQRFRRKLFGGFVVLFVLTSFVIICYSQGYRIDFSNYTITKTGAVYIESVPRTTSIFLNQKLYKNKSSILRSGTLISTVLPKRYRVTISKEGYFDYEKNIEVLPAQVTRLLHILLVPKEFSPTHELPDINGSDFIAASSDGKFITLDTTKNKFYLYAIKEPEQGKDLSALISSFFNQKILALNFYPQETEQFLAKTSKGLYRIDTQKKTSSLITTTPSAFVVEKNNLYVLNSSTATSTTQTTLSTIDLTLNSIVTEKTLDFPAKNIVSFSVQSGLATLLLDNGDLWITSASSKNAPIQIAHDAIFGAISPDAKKIVFQDSTKKVFTHLLEDDITALNMKKGISFQLGLVNIAAIQSIWWFDDSYHLVVSYPGKTVLAEVSAQEPNNQFVLRETSSSLFDFQSKLLYAFLEGVLYINTLSF